MTETEQAPRIMYIWGQVAGVLEAAGVLRGDSLVLRQAAARPALLAPYLTPRSSDVGKRAKDRITELLVDMPTSDAAFPDLAPLAERADYWLGHAHEMSRWRGGRPRPDGDGEPLTRQAMVRMTEAQEARAREIGGGNVAAGLRIALDAYPAEQEGADA